MIDWLLANHSNFVRFSRWIVGGCGLALLAIASLPRTPTDRVIAIIGVCLITFVFCLCVAITLATILHPRLFEKMRRARSEAASKRK